MRTVAALLASAVLLTSASAFAQNNEARCGNQNNRDTATRDQTFCFEGEAVQGGIVGPNGQRSQVLRRQTGSSLIRLRAHFVPEMLRNVENF